MILTQQQKAIAAARCETCFDDLTRLLYATDASLYQVMPVGVAFPKTIGEAASAMKCAHDAGVSITPRGAGSGLTGGAIGSGLVIDFARNNRGITELNLERETIRVGAGVVLDQLNAYLKPYGYGFAPDVATSSRATLGGMIANDSSGARAMIYGTTAPYVESAEIIQADGTISRIGRGLKDLKGHQEHARKIVFEHREEILSRMPPGLNKRWAGYGISRILEEPDRLTHVLAGSEGTLAGIFSAEIRITRLPAEKGLGILFFASVAEAMQATVDLLALKPAAIEHVDKALFDQTRGQIKFKAARDLLGLDIHPCEAFLIVEFYQDVQDRLAAMKNLKMGQRCLQLTRSNEMNLVWGLRKAGLSLITGRAGAEKPVTCIEDVAVRPEHLPQYVADLQSILKRLGTSACFYGHAGSGLLHVRPVLDLHEAAGVEKLRWITSEVSALTRKFKGSFTAEHGVGMARTEFMREQIGGELLGVMREIKLTFDPRNIMNPGKIVEVPDSTLNPVPPYLIDTRLRMGAGYEIKLPFEPLLKFAAKDHSFIRNLEQCNGCGGCTKQTPTMCPTFMATGDESMSTRGRANLIRSVLEGRTQSSTDPLRCRELEHALDNCLSCKACTSECPSNVNMTLLKAELNHARQQREGISARAWIISKVDWMGAVGCLMPGMANAVLEWSFMRRIMEYTLGFTRERPLPKYASERFDKWFRLRSSKGKPSRGKVYLWDDTFVRYHEPHIGKAAVTVLEAAGFEVDIIRGRVCCGRPAFSQGNLGEASRLGQHNLDLINSLDDAHPILFTEPSCWAMFKEDYRELGLRGIEKVSPRCFLLEQFIEELLKREPSALRFRSSSNRVAIHAHCHAKSLVNPSFMEDLARRVPGCKATLLETGCCGMAGAFGAMKSKYDLSLQVGALLAGKIREQPDGTIVIASGTSCRQQVEHMVPVQPKHFVEFLAEQLES